MEKMSETNTWLYDPAIDTSLPTDLSQEDRDAAFDRFETVCNGITKKGVEARNPHLDEATAKLLLQTFRLAYILFAQDGDPSKLRVVSYNLSLFSQRIVVALPAGLSVGTSLLDSSLPATETVKTDFERAISSLLDGDQEAI